MKIALPCLLLLAIVRCGPELEQPEQERQLKVKQFDVDLVGCPQKAPDGGPSPMCEPEVVP